MYSVMQKRKSFMTSMVLQHLRKEEPVLQETDIFIRVMAVLILGQVATGNIILRVAIWMISLMIFLVVCFMEDPTERVLAGRAIMVLAVVSVKAQEMALEDLDRVPERRKEKIWRHRQTLPLKRRPLAVTKRSIWFRRTVPDREHPCRYTFLPE